MPSISSAISLSNYIDGTLSSALSNSSFMTCTPPYDPHDWPEAIEASNNYHSHHEEIPSNINNQTNNRLNPHSSSPLKENSKSRPQSNCNRWPPIWMKEYFIGTMALSNEPANYTIAVQDSHWQNAMHKEMDSIICNGTWKLVSLPPDQSTISTKWVF